LLKIYKYSIYPYIIILFKQISYDIIYTEDISGQNLFEYESSLSIRRCAPSLEIEEKNFQTLGRSFGS